MSFDFSKFRKVSSNAKTTTLRHEQGHELRIAHAALTAKVRDQISALPVHMAEGGKIKAEKKVQKFADGTEDDTVQQMPEGSPSDGSMVEGSAVEGGADTGGDDDEEGSPAPNASPAPAQTQAPAAQDITHPPASDTVLVTGARPEIPAPPAPPTPQDYINDQAQISQDMANGKINPLTAKDLLFPPGQSTLGKIGTIFGMIVGGAGAGLSHQPNALMGMVNDQLNRNLEAQKASQSNAQNWYQQRLAHNMQNSTILRNSYMNALDKAKTNLTPLEAKLMEAQTGSADAMKNKIVAETSKTQSQNQMFAGLLNHTGGIAQGLPPGPTKDIATNINQNVLTPAATQEMGNNITKSVALTNALNAAAPYPTIIAGPDKVNPDGSTSPSTTIAPAPPVVDADKMAALLLSGRLPEASIGRMTDEMTLASKTRAGNLAVNKAFDNLNTPSAGQSNEKIQDAMRILGGPASAIVGAIAGSVGGLTGEGLGAALGDRAGEAGVKEAANVLNKYQQERAANISHLIPLIARPGASNEEVQQMLNGSLPSIYDDGDEGIRKTKFDGLQAYFQGQEQTPTLKIWNDSLFPGLLKPAPTYGYKPMHPDRASEAIGATPTLPATDMRGSKIDFSKAKMKD